MPFLPPQQFRDRFFPDICIRVPDFNLVEKGGSGSGKTDLLCRACLDAQSRSAEDTLLVARFGGTSPFSSDVRGLLRSLCDQLERFSCPSLISVFESSVSVCPRVLSVDLETEIETEEASDGLSNRLLSLLSRATSTQRLVLLIDSLSQICGEQADGIVLSLCGFAFLGLWLGGLVGPPWFKPRPPDCGSRVEILNGAVFFLRGGVLRFNPILQDVWTAAGCRLLSRHT